MEKELRIAKNLALQTWNQISKFYDLGVEPISKKDGTPVTEADKLANKFIVESLLREFPNDNIVSEEDEMIDKNGKRTWHIDPIDGTKGFIKRNGHFAIHIGLVENGKPILGVVYWPVSGDMYSGIKGLGAWRENSRGILELKLGIPIRKNLIASTNGDVLSENLIEIYEKLSVNEFHNCGSGGLRLMKVAENGADIRISENERGTNSWDLCAPQAVFEAAGGFIKYYDGSEIVYDKNNILGKRFVATNTKELMNEAVKACIEVKSKLPLNSLQT